MPYTHLLHIGILARPIVNFSLSGGYKCSRTNTLFSDSNYQCTYNNGLSINDIQFESEIILEPQSKNSYFELQDVTIGVHFHWERNEVQRFKGCLKLIREGQNIRAINIIDIEDYLASVISSEMSATSSLELLKAHAIISRSWVLYPLLEPQAEQSTTEATQNRYIRWYERDAHKNFDVCADDHCQRYQGITRIVSPNVQSAIDATRSMVLKHNGHIVDARFYKCCGGATERFENVWANRHLKYLDVFHDYSDRSLPDLTNEQIAHQWITSEPKAFCNTTDKKVLSQVLNNYDQETHDFYRWSVRYSQEELSSLVKKRSGIDFGTISELRPIKRGPSGRLIELQIIGTKQTIIVGKELEIRKWLSPTHLYSSAFVVDKDCDNNFTLRGAGWGHGVGLCQIGAAVMATEGYDYKQILAHYFPHTTIEMLNEQN